MNNNRKILCGAAALLVSAGFFGASFLIPELSDHINRLGNGNLLEMCIRDSQGGEDPYYTDERICTITKEIKKRYPDCAVTLSIGEKERASYQAYFDAGTDRYLLRHETADEAHYQKLHPSQMSLAHRKQCLRELMEIGYQTG